MDKDKIVEAIKELMEKYNESRAKWIQEYKSDKDFDAWFTKQLFLG